MNADFQPTTTMIRNAPHLTPTVLPPGWLSPGMRRLAWGALLASSAIASHQVMGLALATYNGGIDSAWMEQAAWTAVLAVLPMAMALRTCALLVRRGKALEAGHVDMGTGLYNRAGMVVYGNRLLSACRHSHRVMSMAVFDFRDLLEVRDIYGARIYRKVMARLASKMARVAADRGMAVRTGAAQFTVLMPDVGPGKAMQAIERVLGSPSRIEVEIGDDEIVLVPEVMVEVVTADTGSVEELHVEMCTDLTKLQNDEERRRNYIQRERESHSRPMGLQAQQEIQPALAVRAAPSHVAATPQTMPAPLLRT